MIVYRVEHKNSGQGPYNFSSIGFSWDEYPYALEALDEMHNVFSPTDHPNPKEEFGGMPDSSYIYGFWRESQVNKWFPPLVRLLLDKAGYVIARYEAEHYLIGKTQVAFKKSSAKRLTTAWLA